MIDTWASTSQWNEFLDTSNGLNHPRKFHCPTASTSIEWISTSQLSFIIYLHAELPPFIEINIKKKQSSVTHVRPGPLKYYNLFCNFILDWFTNLFSHQGLDNIKYISEIDRELDVWEEKWGKKKEKCLKKQSYEQKPWGN